MKFLAMLVGVCIAQQAMAVSGPSRPEFHRAVYALHEQQVAAHKTRTEETAGDYKGLAAAGYSYRLTSYFDAKTGKLLSRVQRDLHRPQDIHIVEVNVYDDKGRVIRDFLTYAFPWNPDHPASAYINLHHYNGALHSWRQFELYGEVNYEFCEGELNGKPVRIALYWDQIDEGITSTSEYRACFEGMRNDWKTYLTPH